MIRIPRFFFSEKLKLGQIINLNSYYRKYIFQVLRMRLGELVEIFNSNHLIFYGKIIKISRHLVQIQLINFKKSLKKKEILDLNLGQVVIKDKCMKIIIQKSVELGVKTITPIISKNSIFNKVRFFFEKKIVRWNRIAISACEQCGRNRIPKIKSFMYLYEWCNQESKKNKLKINLYQKSNLRMDKISIQNNKISLLNGPEGGLSEEEIKEINKRYGFINVSLGSSIFRSETSALVALVLLKEKFKDFI